MPLAQQTAAVSLALSIGIAAVAALLGLWLWYERTNREPDLSEADAGHFARQDFRRGLVAVILVILAVGLSVGSRLEPKIDGKTNPWFVQTWLGVIVLVMVLLVLAMIDWMATRVYARRHFRALAKERIDILRDELRRRTTLRHDGRNGTGDPIGDSPT